MLVYIAGKYSAPTIEERQANIDRAKAVAIEWWNAGHTVICPHMNTAHLDELTNLTPEDWYDRTLDLLRRCDAIVMVAGWEHSTGANNEWCYADDMNMPVFLPQDPIPDLHPTEQRCPEQCRSFIDIVMKGYRLHLDKNNDYSPANILATGDIGVAVRLWDKVARYLNLIGFRLEVLKSDFNAPKEPKFESIADSLIDLANYAVIAQVLRLNKWGK